MPWNLQIIRYTSKWASLQNIGSILYQIWAYFLSSLRNFSQIMEWRLEIISIAHVKFYCGRQDWAFWYHVLFTYISKLLKGEIHHKIQPIRSSCYYLWHSQVLFLSHFVRWAISHTSTNCGKPAWKMVPNLCHFGRVFITLVSSEFHLKVGTTGNTIWNGWEATLLAGCGAACWWQRRPEHIAKRRLMRKN